MKQTQKFTTELHNDTKETLVVLQDQLYKLTPTDITIAQVKKMSYKEAPHIRYLSPIPERTHEEQEEKNKEASYIHTLAGRTPERSTGLTIKRAMASGINIPEEVKKLLDLKEKEKDPDKRKAIRKQLRKLDYKRYLNQEGE